MSSGRKSTAKRKPVLADHQRVGKRIIPPLMQVMNLKEVSWMDQLLPELLWLGLLNDQYGYSEGAELALALPRAAMEATQESPKNTWFATISTYTQLSPEEQGKTVEALRGRGSLEPYRKALQPLVHFYPACPLNFLYDDQSTHDIIAGELEDFKNILVKFFNRRGVEATFMQANVIYIGFVIGKLKVVSESQLANLPKIINYPNTEISRKVAASLRATINAFIGDEVSMGKLPWSAYFWNRGLQLEACDFDWEIKHG